MAAEGLNLGTIYEEIDIDLSKMEAQLAAAEAKAAKSGAAFHASLSGTGTGDLSGRRLDVMSKSLQSLADQIDVVAAKEQLLAAQTEADAISYAQMSASVGDLTGSSLEYSDALLSITRKENEATAAKSKLAKAGGNVHAIMMGATLGMAAYKLAIDGVIKYLTALDDAMMESYAKSSKLISDGARKVRYEQTELPAAKEYGRRLAEAEAKSHMEGLKEQYRQAEEQGKGWDEKISIMRQIGAEEVKIEHDVAKAKDKAQHEQMAAEQRTWDEQLKMENDARKEVDRLTESRDGLLKQQGEQVAKKTEEKRLAAEIAKIEEDHKRQMVSYGSFGSNPMALVNYFGTSGASGYNERINRDMRGDVDAAREKSRNAMDARFGVGPKIDETNKKLDEAVAHLKAIAAKPAGAVTS